MSTDTAAVSMRQYVASLVKAGPKIYPGGPNAGAFPVPYLTYKDADGNLIPGSLGIMDAILDEDMQTLSSDIETLAGLLTTANADSALIHQDLQDGNLTQTAVKIALNGVSSRLDTLNASITTLNGYNAGILAAQQAQTLTGTNVYREWLAAALTGGMASLFGTDAAPTKASADAKVIRVVISSSTLAGTLVGGGAKIVVYHCANPGDTSTASGAVVLGTYPVASNATYAAGSGRVIPAGRYGKIQSSNGGCAISLDYA